jgi:hypothetical protein
MELGGCGEGALRTSSWGMRLQFLALILAAATPLEAQYRPIGPAPSRLFAVETGAGLTPDTLPKVGDHRVTGAVIGGVLGGTLGYVLGAASGGGNSCTQSGACGGNGWDEVEFLEVAGGIFLGAGIGYLMGRSTPKGSYPDAPSPATLPKDTGLTPAQGAGIGAAIGAVALSVYAIRNPSSEDGAMVIVAAPLGALVGAFVGYGVTRE